MICSMKYFFTLVTATVIGASVHIDKMEPCDDQDYSITWGLKLKDNGNKQIIEEGFMDSKIDLNNDILVKVSIYRREGDKWNLIASKTDGVCSLKENFVGDFAKGLENAAGLNKTCPYPKGEYHIQNYPLDFSNLKYKDFPSGTNKIRSEYYGKDDDKKMLSCHETEFTLKA